jgi:hypothetical protein
MNEDYIDGGDGIDNVTTLIPKKLKTKTNPF